MSEHKCEGVVWPVGSYRSYPCSKNAAHEHDGHWFCKTHHPPTSKAKSDARTVKWQAERDGIDRVRAANSAAQDEQKRCAKCYPDLLASLQAAHAYVPPSSPVHQQIAAAIAKATGDQA